MTRSNGHQREWYETAYTQLVTNPEVQRAARLEAARLAAGSDLNPQASDLQAARRYLHTCVMRMSVTELENLTAHEAGAFWGRGAYGIAQFRRDKGLRKHRRRRDRRAELGGND
jgi:hypothetical protein